MTEKDYTDKYRSFKTIAEEEDLTEFWTEMVALGAKYGLSAAYVGKSLSKPGYLTWNFYYQEDLK